MGTQSLRLGRRLRAISEQARTVQAPGMGNNVKHTHSDAGRRRRQYPLRGAALALGAPLGLMAVQAACAWSVPSWAWIKEELSSQTVVYGYLLVSTPLIFAALGRILGKKEDSLEASALTDALSEMPNRRSFDARFEEECSRSQRYEQPLSLALVDLDRLKVINDEGGHQAGDRAIRDVADALRDAIRRPDFAARIGGDEFAVILPSTDTQGALQVCERVRTMLRERGAKVTVSMGITELSSHEASTMSPADVLRAADAALYEAKAGGRDRLTASQRAPELGNE
jgi:diguanylate cyclase (GGDEF)-like protein